MLTAAYSKGLLPVASEHVQHRQQHVLSSFRSSGDGMSTVTRSTVAKGFGLTEGPQAKMESHSQQ